MFKKSLLFEFLIFIFVFLLIFFISYVLKPMNGDEVFVYGFCYNISKGLIIYRDFNVLQTPLYFIVGSFFIKAFGSYIISIHIFDAIMVGMLALLLYKLVGWKFLVIILPLFFYFTIDYNLLSLLLLFFIIYFVHKDKNYDDIIALIVGLLFITKQNIGICLLIPCLFYSKNRIKSFIIFLLPVIILSIYFIYYHAIYQFIDYCFLGMLDFGGKNQKITIFALFEVIVIIILMVINFKCRFKNQEYFYLLMFQIVSYPMFDDYHFFLAFFPVLYLIIKHIKNKYYLLSLFGIFLFFIVLGYCQIGFDICLDQRSIFYLRNDINQLEPFMKNLKEYIDDRDYDIKYFYSDNRFNYLLKLYYDVPIGQYDLLLSGNMGYHGAEKKFRELSKICNNHQCLFFIMDKNYFYQFDEFHHYVVNNYYQYGKYWENYTFYSS